MAEPKSVPLDDLITVPAAAELIGCAVGSVKRHFLSGKLRRYKVGRGTRLSRQEVELVFPVRPTILQDEDLISVQQAAELLSVRAQTLYRWVRDSKLQGVKIGLHSYVSKLALEKLVLDLTANQTPIPGQFTKGGGKLTKGANPSPRQRSSLT